MKKEIVFIITFLLMLNFVFAADNSDSLASANNNSGGDENNSVTSSNNEGENDEEDLSTAEEDEADEEVSVSVETEKRVCCMITIKLQDRKEELTGSRNKVYRLVGEDECIGENERIKKEIVEDSLCENIKEAIKERNRLRFEERTGQECPEGCSCTGVAMKCELANGRMMTIYAGRSGNTIVQVKETNVSTKVVLYHHNNKTYGNFSGEIREIKVLPDNVKERIRERIKTRLENENVELDEDGYYQIDGEKRARLFLIIPVRERVRAEINSETGEIIKVRNPWWGFLARDRKEEQLVGDSCGTVTPGENDACCQNKGYERWNNETEECE